MPRNETDADSRRAQSESQTGGGQNPQGQPQQSPQDGQQPSGQQASRGGSAATIGELFASAAVRWGIGIAGFVLFLFALGQAVGLNLLGMFADALSSQTVQWLLVAVFALFLIGVASRGVKETLGA